MKLLRSLPILIASAHLGCGAAREQPNDGFMKPMERAASPAGSFSVPMKSPTPVAVTDGSSSTILQMTSTAGPTGMASMMGGMMGMAAPSQADKVAPPVDSPAMSRKIIYDAQIDLVVKDVAPISKQLSNLVQEARGYIAEESTTGSPGSQRSMRWKIRVPVDQFESFAQKVVALGELERAVRTSQDVTEQYYDLEARIKNKKVEEKTLTKILEERTGKLEDVLKVEVELSRVRGEIEQLEGRIRVLEHLSALATLTLSVREREKYEPPPPVAADFPTQIARTWDSSIHGLINLFKSVVLWVVDWAVWIPLLIVAALLGWVIFRWLIRVLMRALPRLIALARTPITLPRPPSGSE
jgi:hypothetical protein